MKNIKYISSCLILCTILLAGCEDFLNREPLDSGTEAVFFKTPEQFAQAANALYQMEGWKNYDGGNIMPYGNTRLDIGTDISGFGNNGGGSAGESNWRWDRPYSYIRNCNILLAKATEYAGNATEIAQSVGTAYFFRAWQHFYLLQYFGGTPIVDHTLDLNDPVVKGARNSRYEVANFIISDLRTAIPLLPKEKDIAGVDKGKVSQEAAKAFLARVLLYEATWEKYVPGIGYDLDGNGSGTGAGTAKPENYPGITDMLTEAKKWAGEVIAEAETGTFQLWNECDSLSYYYLFNIDDKGGNISNFRNVGKITNKEFIFSVKYDYDIRRPAFNLGYTCATNQFTQISAYLGEMFLCHNGLPIRVSNSDGLAGKAKNEQFLGVEKFCDEYRNRDYRFIGCTYVPDRVSWMSASVYGFPNDGVSPYPDPVYPKDTYDPGDPAFNDKRAVFRPMLLPGSGGSGTMAHGGYGSRKFMPEGQSRNDNTESPDYPLIRLAEVHLIYAEAAVELGGGQISDQDLNFSINKNRARAGVAPLTNALIAGKWDCGWWDHATNKTICKQMNMLDEIRRERATELFGEGFRENDLKRWGMAHIALTGQKLGRHIYGTEYMTATANNAMYYGQPVFQPDRYPLTHSAYGEKGIYVGTGANDPDYGRYIATLPENLLYSQRDYLAPIPLGQIRLNESLTQNPGW